MFHRGEYIRYMGEIWIVEDFYEDMMFIRSVEDGRLEIVLEFHYSDVEVY